MLSLRTLGGLYVANEDGEPIAGAVTQRRVLALLAVLAVAGDRGVTRDKLLALLWPEADAERARHSLTQAVYSARRALGIEDLFLPGSDLRLNPERVRSDVQELEAAVESGDLERAARLYQGPFADGFFLAGSAEFEQWSSMQRARLEDRIAGLAREMIFSRVLGANEATDAFLQAFILPNAFRRLFAEGAFSAAFVPMFSRRLKRGEDEGEDGLEAAKAFSNDVLSVILPALIVLCALVEIAMPGIIWLWSPEWRGDENQLGFATDLARINRIPSDWGLEIGTLVEVYRNCSQKRVCQVELTENYDHRHQDLSEHDATRGLHRMVRDIASSAIRNLASYGVQFDSGFLNTLTAAYRRTAQDAIASYNDDAALNGLVFDRHEEEFAVETFSGALRAAGLDFVRDPMEVPQIPNWNRVASALPEFLDELREAVDADASES